MKHPNPRQVCIQALLDWEKGKSFSDEILHTLTEKSGIAGPDRAFLMEAFFGVLRNLSLLDFFIAHLREAEIDERTRAVLRLGLYQVFQMRTAPHAAVNESVELAGRARGVVNAVLRRALRERDALEHSLKAAPLSVRMSHPQFLLSRWFDRFGSEATELLCAWDNSPAPLYVRANGLRVTAADLLSRAPGAEASPFHHAALRVRALPHEWIAAGLCYIQDPSTLMACDLLNPQPGDAVLDACAAPGGKSTYLAELMRNTGRLVACDIYDSRVERLRENLARLGVANAEPIVHDAMLPLEESGGRLAPKSMDRVLVDAPCSNTGVLRRRVDVRWRLTGEDFIRMPFQQFALVRRCAETLKPGGVLVYSTCSLENEENDGVVGQIAAAGIGLRHIESRRTLPFIDGVDGAFAAKFVRE